MTPEEIGFNVASHFRNEAGESWDHVQDLAPAIAKAIRDYQSPPDTSLLLAYAECEDVLSGDKPVAWGVIESTLKRHGYTGTIAVPLMKAWTRDLRRRALAGETK